MDVKKLALVMGSLALVLAAIFYFQNPKGSSNTLKLCTWSNYYPESMLQEFTKSTGIKVQLSYISSNEELFAKLKAGATGLDLIQPSDYMVRQMVKADMLKPIDHGSLSHLHHLDDYYRNLSYDPGLKHSIPFTWGTTGIAINTDKVKIPKDGVSWKLLFDSPDPGHTSMLDDMREVFAAALKWKGRSVNSKEASLLESAKLLLLRAKGNILLFSSEPKALLLREEVTIAHIYSSDAIQAHQDQSNIQYFIPLEGGVIWTDNFALPKTAQHVKEAHTFINYFLDPKNARQIAELNLLSTVNRTALGQLNRDLTNDPNLYPPREVLEKLQFLDDLGETNSVINRMWTELKSS